MSTIPSTNQLWLQYMNAFTEEIKLGGVPQLLSPPSVWDWGDKNPPIGSLPYQQVMYLNQIPMDPLSNANEYGSRPGFGQNYQLFLGQIATSDGGEHGTTLAQNVTNDIQALSTVSAGALVSYNNFVSSTNSSMTYTEWLASPNGAANAAQVSQAEATLANDQDIQRQYMKSLSGPITDASEQYTAGLVSVVGQGSTTGRKLPGWQTDQTAYGYIQNITGNNFGGAATKGNAKSFTITQDSSGYKNTSVYASAETGFLGDFFGIEASGSYKKVTTSSFSSSYSITFSFQDLTPIAVSAGAWYNPAIPPNYVNGPFQPNHSGYKSGTDIYYFGQGGNLSREISQMLIGYRPTIVIDAGQTFATSLEQEIHGGGALVIGPFAFGGSGGSSTQAGTVDISGSKITCTGKGDWGYIVGMITNWVVNPQ